MSLSDRLVFRDLLLDLLLWVSAEVFTQAQTRGGTHEERVQSGGKTSFPRDLVILNDDIHQTTVFNFVFNFSNNAMAFTFSLKGDSKQVPEP